MSFKNIEFGRDFLVFAAVLIAGLSSVGCSKDSDANPQPEYYFRFKVDGSTVDYSDLVSQAFYPGTTSVNYYVEESDIYQSMIFSTANVNEVLKNALQIVTWHREPFSVNVTYSTTGSASSQNVPHFFQFGYYDSSGTLYFAREQSYYEPISLTATDATIRFTEISDTRIKGTFSGMLHNHNQTVWITITEGEFQVPSQFPQ
ncbi:hypothetical protein LZF95_00395 [Algoriphagus sp. AGSA1]|uniref:hypothetical protein n=1 Tax=Algoriphagus sp. AGSA1 TaxID=2907213 RepID=UPI001F228DA8|nr:hypothetical protein [Algoriphagus sp. AGSA1]MCE7053113.1 hypothetical protein [Algoriphagus sp. AGSA1]